MTTTVGAVDARLGPGRLAVMGHQHVRFICAGATAVPLHTIGAVITATAASAKHV